MISYEFLRKELKRYPGYIKKEIKSGHLEIAVDLQHQMETIKWILEDSDNA